MEIFDIYYMIGNKHSKNIIIQILKSIAKYSKNRKTEYHVSIRIIYIYIYIYIYINIYTCFKTFHKNTIK